MYIIFWLILQRAKESNPVLVDLHHIGSFGFDIDKMKFVDEWHISTKNGQETWGYAPRGDTCVMYDNFVRRERHTVVSITSIYGLLSHKIQAGSMK